MEDTRRDRYRHAKQKKRSSSDRVKSSVLGVQQRGDKDNVAFFFLLHAHASPQTSDPKKETGQEVSQKPPYIQNSVPGKNNPWKKQIRLKGEQAGGGVVR